MNNDMASGHHYLLTALGTSPKQTIYALGTSTAGAEPAPLALLRLLEQTARPDTVLCLLTPTAREKAWEDSRSKVDGMDIDVRLIDIPEGDDARQVVAIVQSAASSIGAGARLTLDITHGPRHIPLVFYALALYLSSLKGVAIEAVWHDKYESADEAKPPINLRSLLEFPKWFYAVKLFRETGVTSDLANRFRAVQNDLSPDPGCGPPRRASKALDAFSKAYESGLPLELGLEAGKLCHTPESRPL